MRLIRTALAAAVLLAGLSVPGAVHAAASVNRVTGELTLWASGEGTGETHDATVDTGKRELRVPYGLLPAGARTGDRVSVTMAGRRVSAVRVVSHRVRAQAAITDGPRRVLVIVTSTTSPAASPTSTQSEIAAVMAQVDERYRAYSNNRVSFSADIVTATITSASCFKFSDNIKNAEAAAGVDTTPYRHVVVFVPALGCSYVGRASLGGDSTGAGSVVVISPSFNRQVVTHEIGHNLGLEHSASLWCGDATTPRSIVADWSTACTQSEYGDNFSPMGAYDALSIPAPQLLELGWLDQSQIAPAGSGTVKLSPVAGTTGTRAIVLPDPSAMGAYWVEYRAAVGADALMSDPGQIQVRFQPKLTSTLPGMQTALLNVSGVWSNRWSVPGMRTAGQVFSDPTGRLTVTVVSVGATATVSVVEDPASLSPAPVGLAGTFVNNDLAVSFTAPNTGLRVKNYSARLSDPSGVFLPETPLYGTSGTFVGTVRPGPFTLTVTATMTGGRTGSTSLDLVAPDYPAVSISKVTPTVGGARITLALSRPVEESSVDYTVVASRPGHTDRSVSSWTGSLTLAGLPGGGRWTLTATASAIGATILPASATLVPKSGGITLGKVTRKKDGSASAVLTVPRAKRADGVARVWVEWPEGAKVVRKRIPRSGRVTLQFAANLTRATVTVGRTELSALVLGTVAP